MMQKDLQNQQTQLKKNQHKFYYSYKKKTERSSFLCNKKLLQNFLLHKKRSTMDGYLHEWKNVAKQARAGNEASAAALQQLQLLLRFLLIYLPELLHLMKPGLVIVVIVFLVVFVGGYFLMDSHVKKKEKHEINK